jgi:hypothetical protein
VQITVSNGPRQLQTQFAVTPGFPATLTLSRLPTGTDTFLAAAYNSPQCPPSVNAVPTWTSDLVQATVSTNQTTNLTLRLLPAGGTANVGLDFGDGGV